MRFLKFSARIGEVAIDFSSIIVIGTAYVARMRHMDNVTLSDYNYKTVLSLTFHKSTLLSCWNSHLGKRQGFVTAHTTKV